MGNGVGASIDTSHYSVEPRLQVNAAEATDPVSSGVSANTDTLGLVQHRSVQPQLQAEPEATSQATFPVLQQGPDNDAVEQQESADPEAAAEIYSQPWSPSDPRYKKGTQSLEQERLNSDNSDASRQAAVDTQQQEHMVDTHEQELMNLYNPDVKKQAMVDTQQQELTSANSDVQQQPMMDTDKQEPVDFGNSDVQQQMTVDTPMKEEVENFGNSHVQQEATVDTQKQDFSMARDSMVQPHQDSQDKDGGRQLNNAMNNPPNKGSFQAVVGTSGKVAHVGKPRQDMQAKPPPRGGR